MNVTLPNGKVIRNVPEDADKNEIARKAINAGIATVDDFVPKNNVNTAERAREAVRSQAEDMSGMDRFMTGVGRGVTDLGQVGRQLFESSPIGGLTDISAEEYQSRVGSELDTYDEGLGDSFTAGAGRFVGQTVPAAMAGGAGGMIARGLGNTAARSASGGAIVSGATGGASTQAGEDTEDILMAGGIGGVTGAATGVLSNRLGAASRNRPVSDMNISEQTDNILTRPVDKIIRDVMRRLSSGSKPQSFRASATFGADAPPSAVSRVGSRFRDEMADLGEKATMSFPELLKSTNLYDLGTGAIGYTAGGPLGAAGAIAGRRGATALGRLGAAGVRDTVERAPNLSSAVMGNVGGDMGEETHQRVLSSIIEEYSTKNDEPDDEKAAMHELSQTNPAFRIALDRALQDN